MSLDDVFDARTHLEPVAVRLVARSRSARAAARRLRELTARAAGVIDDPEPFGRANARFHEVWSPMAGNQTLTIVAEMLNEVVARAVAAVSQ